jgi:release factor glutamine methyltransferase
VPEALELAKTNAERLGVTGPIEFRTGALLEPLHSAGGAVRFDVIASNPPYVPDDEWDAVERNVKDYEPASALRGGVDGLDFIRPLIANGPSLLVPGGLLAIEIAESQREAVVELAKATATLENVDVLKDHEGLLRVLTAERIAP